MSYNGSGTFQINTSGQPVVAGTVISSTAFNALTADLANGLSTAITKDGQTTVTNNIPMAGFKITGLGAATVGTDAARYSQIQGGTDKLITVSGTDTLTGSMTPALTAYAAGNQFSFVVANTNTGAVTINIDGVGVKSITKTGSTALAAGDLTVNTIALIEYDGTRFQLINVASGNVTGPASSTANAIPTFSDTTGKIIQNNSGVKIVSNNITMDGSTSGTLTVAASAIAGTNTLTLPATTGTVAVSSSSTDYVLSPYTGFKNRIINGAMVIDQRNAGASATINTAAISYTLDRWAMYGKASAGVFTVQQSTSVVPNNFTSSMKITVTTADSTLAAGSQYSFRQRIEGYNIADFGFGTSAATALTLSFKVRSSVTGTFGGALFNDTGARCMPFSYTISVADTWTNITVAVPAETAGTWLTTNGDGLEVLFLLGCDTAQKGGTASTWGSSFYLAPSGAVNLISTLNATLYITGVQLEKGSTATSFDYRPYGTELMLCQRYYLKLGPGSNFLSFDNYNSSGASCAIWFIFPVSMRATPTGSISAIGDFGFSNTNSGNFTATGRTSTTGSLGTDASATARCQWYTNNANAFAAYSIEL